MSNIESTECSPASIELEGATFRDEILTFDSADTYAAGTLLARQLVAEDVEASAVTGTGDGTVTDASVVAGPVVPLVGEYVLTCIEEVVDGGVFTLTDPNGALVADYLELNTATTFEVAGLAFTITDGATDFAAGDTATLTVAAADGTLVPFDPDGVGGVQLPLAVLTYEVSRTGAGTVKVRALVAGKVNADRLIIDADGDASNITAAILDQLRSAGIVAETVQQLAGLDNQ